MEKSSSRLIIGISGASGVIYGVRLLEFLREAKVETHLIISPAAEQNIEIETEYTISYVKSLATYVYEYSDVAAGPASGSFKTDGMAVIPCSMKTLAGIALGYTENLLTRAAIATLKENRRLVLVPRETPLSIIHIQNMLRLARAGAVILPAMPGFYHRPKTVTQLVDHVVGKVLDVLNIEHELYERWGTGRK